MTKPVDPLEDPLLRDVPVVEGRKQLDSCRIIGWLGKGGMGNVYRAHHFGFDFEVAIKCLNPALSASDPNFVDKFRREARLAATLTHQNLIRVFSVGEEHGIHFIVMEIVEGETLAQLIKRKGRLAEDEAQRIILLTIKGLAVAHRANVVHRDIKPGNIMLSGGGEVKLADLGLAKAVDAAEELTATAVAMGTPAYMPPEQWYDARSVGKAGDIYALGATWYCALAGRAPFRGKSPEIMRQACAGKFPDVRDEAHEVTAATAAHIARCTELEASARYRDATELLDALEGRTPPAPATAPATDTERSEPDGTRVMDPGEIDESPEGTRVAPPAAKTGGGRSAHHVTDRGHPPEGTTGNEPTRPETALSDVFADADSAPSARQTRRPSPSRFPRKAAIAGTVLVAVTLGILGVTQLMPRAADAPDDPDVHTEPADDRGVTSGDERSVTPTGETRDVGGDATPSGDQNAQETGDATPAVDSSDLPNGETTEPDDARPQPPVTREFAISTSPRVATLYVDGTRRVDDGFGTYRVPLTEGIHTLRVVPLDGTPEATFEYDVSPEEGRRRILLDYAAGTISDSE